MSRVVVLVLCVLCVASSIASNALYGMNASVWPLLIAAMLLSPLWQRRLLLPGTVDLADAAPSSGSRQIVGGLLSAVGLALWIWAPVSLVTSWVDNFNLGWIAFLCGTALLSIGLDLVAGRWRRAERGSDATLWLVLALLVLVALVLRFGTFVLFPAESHITQIEELQVGGMGSAYLNGWRQRWEYLSHAWLGALGIWLGGPNLMAMRAPFTILSALKVIPLFLWLRFAVGNVGALVGTTLLAFSAWDVTFARVPTNQNTLVAALVFALLSGPALRGRPSAYLWLGFSSGYVLYEYVVYRAIAVYALMGSGIASIRQRPGPAWRRAVGPLLALALFLVMGGTLYLYVQKTGTAYQYFDGLGRARAQGEYYNPNATWNEAVWKRILRARDATALFFFNGDLSPVRNRRAEPVVDPVTAILVLFGIGFGLANPFASMSGLAVFAFLTTLAGTLVVTGNFDVVRAGGSVVYLYGLAGYGASSFLQALRASFGRRGYRTGGAILVVAIVVSCAQNTLFLWEFCTSPEIRKAQFRELAYVSGWLGRNVKPGEYVEAIVPGYTYLFEINDATWMRGSEAQGSASWDVAGALEKAQARPGPFLWFVYAGESTHAVREYLQDLFPEVQFKVEPGPNSPDADIVHGSVEKLPGDLAQRLEASKCRYAEGSFRVFEQGTAEPVFTLDARLPFVDSSTWPQIVQGTLYRLQSRRPHAEATFFGRFAIEQGGTYTFATTTHPGVAEVWLDGAKLESQGPTARDLEAGEHRLEVRAKYEGGELPMARILWSGPDVGATLTVLPFYRVGVCASDRSGIHQ